MNNDEEEQVEVDVEAVENNLINNDEELSTDLIMNEG